MAKSRKKLNVNSELCWTPAASCSLLNYQSCTLSVSVCVCGCVWVQPLSVSLQLVAEGENVNLSALVKYLLSNQLFRQIWHFLNFPPVGGALLSKCVWECVVECLVEHTARVYSMSVPEFSRESSQGHCLSGCQSEDQEWILRTSRTFPNFRFYYCSKSCLWKSSHWSD